MWPSVVMTPQQWLASIVDSYALPNLAALLAMAGGQSPAFAGGGLPQLLAVASFPIAFFLMFSSTKGGARKDPDAPHGAARWANRAERAMMDRGVEFGVDIETGKPIRAAVEGNILTIAPPRSGKTSGLIIPNMLVSSTKSWNGPAVVIDPKAQAYRAVAQRRRDAGRVVRCLDPMNLAGGSDRWNPLATLDPSNIIYLQRVARALLPAAVSEENAYFQNRAVDAIVAALLAAHKVGGATPQSVSDLLSNAERLGEILKDMEGATVSRVRELLTMDPKTRDPILSTSQQSFQWCDDPRLQHLTSESTFSLADLCRGDVDLFINLPTEDLDSLAPFIRWFLTDLFAVIRRNRVAERLIIFVDETRTLSRSRELIGASGELPGYGASLWTFWQDYSQIISVYGDHDAATLLRTAEFVTVSDPAAVDPDAREFWSRALSDFSIFEQTSVSESGKSNHKSTSESPRAVRLMTSEELGRLASTDLILFANSSRYAKRPMRLRKTRHDDHRFAGLAAPVAPVGVT
ncbi:type IV secretory system conjugative DNA transfer family protein [Tardiphaga sp.]|uniref:type IV secretory system conjugative DNA transfer family protein n=1 Tax=Tardiphaga sp. TaxID=1926292 RepID=UPI002611F064|nr:type IV secretory system conjugative DNA transfer family protein [Tardiphaga sp.]